MNLKGKNRRKSFYDLMLIGGVLLAALAGYVLLHFTQGGGQTVVIKKDGAVIAEKPAGISDTVVIDDSGYNRIVIDGDSVYMENADCPDKICVKTGRISRAGETIVCLPHKVVVEIKGKGAVDSVVQ